MNEDNQVDDVNVSSVEPAEDAENPVEVISSSGSIEKKPEMLHLKTKPVPAVITLLGGAVAAIDVFIQQMDFKDSLIIILVSLLAFLIVGEIVKLLLDRIEIPNPDTVDDDGNVIEKGKSGTDEESDEDQEASS